MGNKSVEEEEEDSTYTSKVNNCALRSFLVIKKYQCLSSLCCHILLFVRLELERASDSRRDESSA